MSDTVQMIFSLCGGLAMFLFGMNSMSEALQKTAGQRMKHILAFLTKNPIMGALAGTLVTAVLQSSSATTVMVIGFVSAGLMSLPQAISVIFGANIGTTMTAQLIAFQISDYIYPIIFVGFMLNFVAKQERVKNIGMVIFSFGLLFEGIEIMGNAMAPLATSPVFTALIARVSDIPILGLLLGAGMTLIVQSSSATIAVLQNFASQPAADGISSVIGLAGAIPILLGDNIGTTITALLASIGQSKNAKRTAIAHSTFNITGSAVFMCIIPWFVKFVEFISPKGYEVDIISRQIANAHTTFNVVCTLIWLPLIPLMVKIVTTIIPGSDERDADPDGPHFLDANMMGQPAAALHLVTREIDRCADYVVAMMDALRGRIAGQVQPRDKADFAAGYRRVKALQEQISQYLTHMFSLGGLTERQSEQAAGLLYVTSNLDRIADRCGEIDETLTQLEESGKPLSETAAKDVAGCFKTTAQLFDQAMDVLHSGSGDAQAVMDGRDLIRKLERKIGKAHLKRVEDKTCDADMTARFNSILYSLNRIADNCSSIAEESANAAGLARLTLVEDVAEA